MGVIVLFPNLGLSQNREPQCSPNKYFSPSHWDPQKVPLILGNPPHSGFRGVGLSSWVLSCCRVWPDIQYKVSNGDPIQESPGENRDI